MEPISTVLKMTDVMADGDKCASPIDVKLEFAHDAQHGICVGFNEYEYRIVIENKEGDLVCHIWATQESIGNDPTHSIVIEPDEVDHHESNNRG